MSSDPGLARPRAHRVEELLGVRSSKGRYYREYRHSAQDLERTLMAVNAVSWALAAAPADARRLVDSTLPVMGELLRASAVVLSCDHPGLGGPRLWTPAPGTESAPALPGPADELLRRAGALADEAPPSGAVRTLPDLGCTVLLARLPAGARGAVVAALPPGQDVDRTDLAILGTLTNQLAGALESCRRLEASEALRDAADAALRRADEQTAALARRNEQLRRTRSDLLAAREAQLLSEERQRIARDLHDSVAQHVLSMGMQVQWCRNAVEAPEVAERLGDITDLARLTVERIRQAIFELSGGDELQHGLVPALRRLAEQHTDHGLTIRVRVLGRPVPLPQAAERMLYMAAKEALFNVVLHAEATRAAVHLVHTATAVRLHVSDDGLGGAAQLREMLRRERLPSVDGYHRGLANVEQRAQLTGARLTFHDAPRGGVRLQVTLPLDTEERA